MNRVILRGNLTRDPELRYTPNNTAVVDAGLAVNERYKGSNGDTQESVSFFDLVFWGRQAEVLNEYCQKGRDILIEGRLKQETWETEEGDKRSKVKVIVERFEFGRSSNDVENNAASADSTPTPTPKKKAATKKKASKKEDLETASVGADDFEGEDFPF